MDVSFPAFSNVKAAPQANVHVSYRPDIDGLRAIAILSVLIYHAFPAVLKGGFVGVDIFFVISGFLITSIVTKASLDDKFSYLDFYSRRIRRIFPALTLVLLSTLIAGWFVLLGDEYKALTKHVLGSLGFVENLILRSESGYFDGAAESKPLLHIWSLGVEEQFYLALPLLVAIAVKFRRYMSLIFGACIALSFGLNLLHISQRPSDVFFLPQYRVWELLIGSLLAIMTLRKPALISSQKLQDSTSCAGLLLILLALAVIDKNRQFPGWWAILPVLGAALLIAAGPRAVINRRFLSNRAMVGIGLISYPLYLWHWPLFSFAYIYYAGEPGTYLKLALSALALSLAWGTYAFVEKPLRQALQPRKAVALLLSFSAVLIAGCGYIYSQGGFPDRQGDKQEFASYFANGRPDWHYFTAAKIPELFRMDCDWYNMGAFFEGKATNTPVPSVKPECYHSDLADKVMFWGDSHAQQYLSGVSRFLPKDVAVLSVASSACLPNLPELDTSPAEYCRQSNKLAIEAASREKPQVVVIGQIIGHDTSNNLTAMTTKLKDLGVKHVIVMGPVPRWETKLYEIVLRKYWRATPRFVSDDLVKDVFSSDKTLEEKYAAGGGGFEYLSMTNFLCRNHSCTTYVGENRKLGLTTFDNSHLSPAASSYVAEQLLGPQILKDLGRK